VYGQLSLEHRFRFGLNGKNGAPANASSQTKNYEITLSFWGDGGIVPFEPFFFMLFPEVWRKLQSIGFR
jgi:hypothetical protein